MELFQYPAQARFPLTLGQDYVVYSLVWWWYGMGALVLDDLLRLHWAPVDLFEVVDGRVPVGWRFGLVPDHDFVRGILGHDVLVSDPEYHDRLVHNRPDAVATFLSQRDKTCETVDDIFRIRVLEEKLANEPTD